MAEEQKQQITNLEQQLETERKRSEDYLTRLKYMQADYENLQKRCNRQIDEVRQYGNERLILELLDVVDELDMAVKSGKAANEAAQPVVEGVQMTLKKLRKVLEQEGVAPMACEGKAFDPTKHNAVATVEKPDVKGCVVVEEIRKGYTLKDKVIRPSIVKVAVQPSNSNFSSSSKTQVQPKQPSQRTSDSQSQKQEQNKQLIKGEKKNE